MKTLKSLKYILFSLIVLGCFANFAQNEYGLLIAKFALTGLILAFVFDTMYFIRKEKEIIPERNRKLILSLTITAILSLVCTIVLANSSRYDWIITMVAFISLISFSILIFSLSHFRPLLIESLSFFLYTTGMLFKLNHWPLAGMIISLSTILLICYFISGMVSYFKIERKQNTRAAWFMLLVFLMIILNLSGILFKVQHWFGGNHMGYLAALIWLFIFACLIFRIKFNYSNGKISFWRLISKSRGNFILIFLFYSIGTIYFILSMSNVVPRFYSNARPEAMIQLLEKENGQTRFDNYYDAYYNFLDNRREFENKEDKK